MKMGIGLAAGIVMMGLGYQVQAAGTLHSQSTPALIEKGRAVYSVNCQMCHGEKGDGNGPAGAMMKPKPRTFSDIKGYKGKYKGFKAHEPQGLFETATKGLPGTSMPGYAHLSEEDRWALAHYITDAFIKTAAKK